MRLRFGLRNLFVLVAIAAVVGAFWQRHVARQKAIEKALVLLSTAPSDTGNDHEPVALIRVVNHLHSMGRQDAIRALEQFAAKNPNHGYRSPHQSLQLVVPLLFQRRSPTDKLPGSGYGWIVEIQQAMGNNTFGLDSDRYFVLDESEWQKDHCVRVQDGIPFHSVYIAAVFGNPGNQSYLVDWARDHCKLRDKPLVPTDDPFSAAELLFEEIATGSDEYRPELRAHLRKQAYRTVSHLLVNSPRSGLYPSAINQSPTSFATNSNIDIQLLPNVASVENWEEIAREYKTMDIYWDAENQLYASRQNDAKRKFAMLPAGK